jgi:putative intracellular protease/amidase
VENSILISEVDPQQYDAIYFVGGKGTMFDFPNNAHIQALVSYFSVQNKVIAAVCHGPAAFVNVKSENGKFFIENKTLSSFTNDEELFLIPKAKEIFPFLLQSKLEDFVAG